MPVPLSGFIQSLPSNMHGEERPSSVVGAVMVSCHRTDACPGGPLNECGKGYTGVRCGDCDDGYFSLQDECFACPSYAGLLAAILAMLPFIFTWMVLDLSCRQSQHTGLALLNNLSSILFLYQGVSFDWHPALRNVFNVAGLMSLDLELFAPECTYQWIGDAKVNVLTFWSILPFFFIVTHIATFSVIQLARVATTDWRKKTLTRSRYYYSMTWFAPLRLFCGDSTMRDVINVHLASLLRILTFVYPIMVEKNLGFFQCIEIEDGSWRVSRDPALTCHGDEWNKAKPIASLNLAVYVLAAPIALAAFIFFNRNRIHESKFYAVLWPVLIDYTPEAYFWGIVDLMLSFGVFAMTVIFLNPLEQVAGICVLLLFFMLLVVYIQPFKFDTENLMTLLSAVVMLLVLQMGAVGSDPASDKDAAAIAGVCVVIIMTVLIIVYAVVEYYLKYQELTQERASEKERTSPEHRAAAGAAAVFLAAVGRQFSFEGGRKRMSVVLAETRKGSSRSPRSSAVLPITPKNGSATDLSTVVESPGGSNRASPEPKDNNKSASISEVAATLITLLSAPSSCHTPHHPLSSLGAGHNGARPTREHRDETARVSAPAPNEQPTPHRPAASPRVTHRRQGHQPPPVPTPLPHIRFHILTSHERCSHSRMTPYRYAPHHVPPIILTSPADECMGTGEEISLRLSRAEAEVGWDRPSVGIDRVVGTEVIPVVSVFRASVCLSVGGVMSE